MSGHPKSAHYSYARVMSIVSFSSLQLSIAEQSIESFLI
jgi:hypothetical protein